MYGDAPRKHFNDTDVLFLTFYRINFGAKKKKKETTEKKREIARFRAKLAPVSRARRFCGGGGSLSRIQRQQRRAVYTRARVIAAMLSPRFAAAADGCFAVDGAYVSRPTILYVRKLSQAERSSGG